MKQLLTFAVIAVAMMIVLFTTPAKAKVAASDSCITEIYDEEVDDDTGCTLTTYSEMCIHTNSEGIILDGTFRLYEVWTC